MNEDVFPIEHGDFPMLCYVILVFHGCNGWKPNSHESWCSVNGWGEAAVNVPGYGVVIIC